MSAKSNSVIGLTRLFLQLGIEPEILVEVARNISQLHSRIMGGYWTDQAGKESMTVSQRIVQTAAYRKQAIENILNEEF